MRLLLPILAAVLVTSCVTNSASTTGNSTTSTPTSSARASDFTLRSLEGNTVRLSTYLGKDVVLLSFWATWCAPCLGEMPALETIHQAYKDQGFTLLSISMDGPESLANVETIVRRYNLTYPVLLDEDTRVVAVFNPARDAPFAVLIDREGRIVQSRVGYSVGDEKELEAKIKELVAAK